MNLIKNVIKITNGKNKEEMLWHIMFQALMKASAADTAANLS